MKIINTIESPKKFNVETLLNFLAEKLNIKEDVELSVAYNDSLLNRLSNENVEYSALLQNPVPKQYFLFVKSDINELQYILCHEMVHLSQYERGDLKISSDYKTITGKGNVFDNSHDYACREWEQEAFKLQNKLGKEFKKSK